MKLHISRQIFEKFSNMEFQNNPSSGSRVVPCGRTDRRTGGHDEPSNRFPPFLKRA